MLKPRTYICKETFQVNRYDEDGFDTEEVMYIEQGAMFQRTEDDCRQIGGEVHLDGITADEGTWLEISEETLAMYFEEVKKVNLEDIVDLETQNKANNEAMRKVIDFMVGERRVGE